MEEYRHIPELNDEGSRIIGELKIAKQFDDGSVGLHCAFCDGSGVYPDSILSDPECAETEPCSVCEGRGIVVVHAPIASLIRCAYCDGTGKGWGETGHFVGYACPVCCGRGYCTLPQPEQYAEGPFDFVWALLHPGIVKIARPRFDATQYADSVEAALKSVNSVVKALVKNRIGQELDGASLMQRAFSLDNPVIQLGDLKTVSGRNTQQGYLQIFSGAMTGIRNPKAHENLIITAARAWHFLFLASLLRSKIDEASRPEEPKEDGT